MLLKTVRTHKCKCFSTVYMCCMVNYKVLRVYVLWQTKPLGRVLEFLNGNKINFTIRKENITIFLCQHALYTLFLCIYFNLFFNAVFMCRNNVYCILQSIKLVIGTCLHDLNKIYIVFFYIAIQYNTLRYILTLAVSIKNKQYELN